MKHDFPILRPLLKTYVAELETVQEYLSEDWLAGLQLSDIEALSNDLAEEVEHTRRLVHRLKKRKECAPDSSARFDRCAEMETFC